MLGFIHLCLSLSLSLALCFHDAWVVSIQSMLPASGKVTLRLCLMFFVLHLSCKKKAANKWKTLSLSRPLSAPKPHFLSVGYVVQTSHLVAPIGRLRSTRACYLVFLMVILLNKFAPRVETSIFQIICQKNNCFFLLKSWPFCMS